MKKGKRLAADENGMPSFELLLRRKPAILYTFDLLQLDGEDLRKGTYRASQSLASKARSS